MALMVAPNVDLVQLQQTMNAVDDKIRLSFTATHLLAIDNISNWNQEFWSIRSIEKEGFNERRARWIHDWFVVNKRKG